MRLTPGPGTTVVIVHQRSDGNIARVGSVSPHGDSVVSDARRDVAVEMGEAVALLAKVATQKMMAQGTFAGLRTGLDLFHIRGTWVPADSRSQPRLPVCMPIVLRSAGARATLQGTLDDISLGGARVTLNDNMVTGQVDLLVRYAGFSATLSARVVSIPDERMPTAPVRLQFVDLALPQQRFLRHMVHDLAELSGWEIAS